MLTTTEFLIPNDLAPPEGYASFCTFDEKIDAAVVGLEIAHEQGFTPLASSVVGSVLRGLDHAESDVDIYVVVLDKLHRNKVFRGEDGNDYSFISLESFSRLLSTSIPFVEFLLSPFRVTRKDYAAYFDSLVIDKYVAYKHGLSFAGHTLAGRGESPKALRILLAVWNLTVREGTPLCPREFFDMTWDDVPAEFLEWMEQVRSCP